MHRNELNGALMNGARVRDGEGRFITFYFIIFYTISFFIYKKNTKVINLPSPSLTLDPFISATFNSFLHKQYVLFSTPHSVKSNYTYTFLFLKAMKYPEIYYLCVIDL